MRKTMTENGAVHGIPCGWPSITVFYGIPYAAPPVGDLRWKAPQMPASWDGERDCARASAKCFQPGVAKGGFFEREFYPYEEEMSEDCLYLNIWTPAKEPGEKLPVIFWIHGGEFMSGYGHSAHFNGEHFARQGVILVTINYRVNVFGWLVHPELDAESKSGTSGNYGLLDQIAALKWVHRNIENFGGDPENITLAGQSAGAACVQLLLCSPLSKGLFARAIMQSGGGIDPFPDMVYPTLEKAEEATDLSLLKVNSIEEARALAPEVVLERWLKDQRGQKLRRAPVIDNYVLRESVKSCAKNAHMADVPVIVGYTGKEGLVYAPTYQILENLMRDSFGETYAGEYLAYTPRDEKGFKLYQSRMASEFMQAAAESYAIIRDRSYTSPTYVYCLMRELPGDDMGPFHASDLWYVFQTYKRAWRPWEMADHYLAYAMNTYWANFAKLGTPNNDENNPPLPLWEPFEEDYMATLILDAKIRPEHKQRNARVATRIRQTLED